MSGSLALHFSLSLGSFRYLLLYEYGGVYLDTDVILLRHIPPQANFLGVESWSLNLLGAGVIKFQPKHTILRRILENLAANFSGSSWGANGPMVLDGEMHRVCESEGGAWWRSGGDADGWTCGGVQIFRQEHFYPVNYLFWEMMFMTKHKDDVLAEHSHSYASHLWGHMSRGVGVEWGSAVWEMARNHCPEAAAGFDWDI